MPQDPKKPFDPNAYLKSKQGFDPDTYLKARSGGDKGFIEKTISNIIPSAKRYGENLLAPITDPVGTFEGVAKITDVLRNPFQKTPEREAFVNFFVDRYGGLENLKKTISEDPVGFLSDASILLGGAGLAAKAGGFTKTASVLSKAGQFTEPLTAVGKATSVLSSPLTRKAGEVLSEVTGATTGAGRIAVEKSVEGSNAFVKAMRGGTEQTEILDRTKGALRSIAEERRANYRRDIADLKGSTKTIDLAPLKNKTKDLLARYNIKESGGELDFSRSAIDRTEREKVSQIFQDISDWGTQPGDNSPAMLDVLKKRLDDFYSESKNSRAIVTELKQTIGNQLEKTVPGYKKMNQEYAQSLDLEREIEKALSIGKRGSADTALRKLMSSLKQNNDFRADMVRKLEQAGGGQILDELAGVALQGAYSPTVYGRMVAGVGALASLLDPKFAAIFAMASPRVVGELGLLFGRTKRALGASRVAPAARTGFQLGRLGDIPPFSPAQPDATRR